MSFVSISDIVDLCQAEAVANRLDSNSAYRWRRFCREYSKAFSTPYHQVLEMDPEFVILATYELELDDVNPLDKIHDLMDRIYSIEDPNYEASKERELQDFIKQAEEEEDDRVNANAPVYVPKKKNKKVSVPDKPQEVLKELPKEGYVNLAYLSKQDSED